MNSALSAIHRCRCVGGWLGGRGAWRARLGLARRPLPFGGRSTCAASASARGGASAASIGCLGDGVRRRLSEELLPMLRMGAGIRHEEALKDVCNLFL